MKKITQILKKMVSNVKFYNIILLCIIGIAFFAVFTSAFESMGTNQANSDCLDCHSDPSLKSEGKKAHSVFVNDKKLGASIHAKNKCVDCHTDLKDAEFPHAVPQKVTCGKSGCHDETFKNYNIGLHGQAVKKGDPLAPTCKFCHGTHEITKINAPNSPVSPMKIPFLCGQCHKEGSPVQLQRNIPQSHILENYAESIHGEGLLKKGLIVAATCASCHSAHLILPHTDNRSSIARVNIAKTCTKCHAQIEQVHVRIIDGKKWEKEPNLLPACVDCHQPHKARKAFYEFGLADKECLKCHENRSLKSSKDGKSLFVDTKEVYNSTHTKTACVQCHTGVAPSHTRPCDNITKKVDCGSCHDKVGAMFVNSSHGRSVAKKDTLAPDCKTCHGTHFVLNRNDQRSRTFKANIPSLCGKCHQYEKVIKSADGKSGAEVIQHYTESIHGKGLLKGNLLATASCADCHGAHRELNHNDTNSTTSVNKISKTCGNCHFGVANKFDNSIHSSSVSKSDKPLPTCKDCHKPHSVMRTNEDQFRFTIMVTCGNCHKEVSETYFDTYHGKATRLGLVKTAKCYDCHGSHDILPPTDPKSHLSFQNIVGTCQKCHKNANRGFTGYLTHATHHDPNKYPWLFLTFWGMTILLTTTFFMSWLHTLLWLPRSLKYRKYVKSLHTGESSGIRIQRFSPIDKVLHVLMICSFLSLATTGMALKFSYTPFAKVIVAMLGGPESAGWLHRLAATTLIGIFIVHVIDLMFNKRKQFNSFKDMFLGSSTMLPTKKDWEDLKGSFKWFLGKGPRPEYGRWTYWEKFDYFAVFWGIFVIGSTGLTLWFPAMFTKILPGSLINIATIIHSDEALLAAGFIFTIHFFNTHFRPEKFPMDTVVFSGSYDIEEFKLDRPHEYQEMVENGTLEQHIVQPPTKFMESVIRIFGWAALLTGLSIVVWIIISIIINYKIL